MIWVDAYEVEGGGVDIGQDGTYQVWVWAPDDEPVTLSVGSKELTVACKDKVKNEYVWLHAGELPLKAGKAEVVLGETAAAIALSTEAGFDPRAAMPDRHASDQPRAVSDSRAQTVRDTDTVFTMPEFDSLEDWEAYAAKLRKRILISCGLLPLPERTSLNAQITDRVEHEDYSVEKVRFEARPGFLVTGNLYRPVGKGPFPGVVCPHGHWERGRIESGERGSVPGRCITLARMGIVAFSYDMIGYNDSLQFKHNWGGDLEKLWGIHPFAMQLWSSIRAVDFIEGLPDVDPERIGCTGASGGGTQTFALMAIDPRIKVAAPVNMISCSMQGGCLCENAPILRLGNSNMEIGALMAPRPLLMVSATGDWTRETPRVEFPAIRSIYKLYGAEDKIESVQVDANHNYNQSSREAMYRFFGKWLLGDDAKWAAYSEPAFTVESDEALRVFPDGKLPEGLPISDQIIAEIIKQDRAKWRAILPKSPAEDEAFRRQYGDALALTMGATLPAANDLEPERPSFVERKDKGYVVEGWVLKRRGAGDAVPAILYRPCDPTPCDAVLIVHGEGKAALADTASGGPGPLVAGLLAEGRAVMTIDAFLLGEHNAPQARTKRREGKFPDTFLPTDGAYRVQDILTALGYLRFRRDLTDEIDVVGLGEGGLWTLFASAMDGQTRTTVIDAHQFDSDSDAAWEGAFYVPCIRSVGDIETAATLLAPRRLQVFNAAPTFEKSVAARYNAVKADAMAIQAGPMETDALLGVLR